MVIQELNILIVSQNGSKKPLYQISTIQKEMLCRKNGVQLMKKNDENPLMLSGTTNSNVSDDEISFKQNFECKNCMETIQLNLFWKETDNEGCKVEESYEEEWLKNEASGLCETQLNFVSEIKSVESIKKEPEFIDENEDNSYKFRLSKKTKKQPILNKAETLSSRTRSKSSKIKSEDQKSNHSSLEDTEETNFDMEIDECDEMANIPDGVILPDLSQQKSPFYLTVEQEDGSKVYVEKKNSSTPLRVTNFDAQSLICELCGFQAKSRAKTLRHRKLHFFQREQDHNCTGCKNIYKTKDDKMKHSYFCTKKDAINVLACNYCDFSAISYSVLRYHLGAKHGPNTANYKPTKDLCHICSKTVSKYSMTQHLLRHSSIEGRPLKCAHCPKRLVSRDSMKNHLVKIHFQNLAKHFCHLCPRVFISSADFNRHLTEHHGLGADATSATCDQCGRVCKNKGALKCHIISQHTDLALKKRYNCSQCDKYFFQKGNYETHMVSHMPEKERPFQCHCGRGFLTKYKLKFHQYEHTNPEKVWTDCGICQKKFKSRSSLKNHMRIHTGETPYCCEYCQKKYTDRSNFRKHMKIHENELGIKLTFTPEERRLMKLKILNADQIVKQPLR